MSKFNIKSSIGFGLLAFALGAMLMMLLVVFAAEPTALAGVKIVNKVFNASLVLVIFVLYKKYFLGVKHETDKAISAHPVAIALDSGLLALAVAYAISGAF